MFDSLKDKLGRFKSDVEESAEEADEAAAAAASEAKETDTAEQPAGPDSEPDADSESKSGDDTSFTERAKMFATGKTKITEEELEGPLEQLELALLQGDVEMSVAQSIVEKLREELVGQTRAQVKTGEIVVEEAIGEALKEVIGVGQFDFDERIAAAEKPVTIIFTGVNGVGKTTTIAKLSKYLEDRGYDVVLANGDTYRAGANEQLREHAEALGKKLITHEQGGDPAAVIYDAVEYAEANDADVVLGDTAGRLHTSNDLMAQLEKIDRVVGPDLTLFVDEAVAGQDATQRAKQFNDAAEIDGVVLTKADADSQGGAAISIAHVTGKPILFLGTGQGYDHLETFDPEVIVQRLVGTSELEA
ncbi:signal recognition particle-docking protein FtsY [Halorarius litoreus]|uniref:signal recognition particle-docking protein FtsY n=1 Tax=Halorarius litoreus TaxID=2962676 RepID=UPI0020CD1F5F|nr:signal recognition particle-docking protein FtsY [Halorarius litoreus]